MSTTAIPAETCRRLAESMAAPRAEGVLALISARPSSPTAQEIRNVLAPPQRAPVIVHEHTKCSAKGRGCYELDVWSVYARAASAYIPRLKQQGPTLPAPACGARPSSSPWKRASRLILSIDRDC
jgi:hypothetical protein